MIGVNSLRLEGLLIMLLFSSRIHTLNGISNITNLNIDVIIEYMEGNKVKGHNSYSYLIAVTSLCLTTLRIIHHNLVRY